ncbi:MAG: hypothetical protein R3B57_13055 [Phycisphaerales bacterium]
MPAIIAAFVTEECACAGDDAELPAHEVGVRCAGAREAPGLVTRGEQGDERRVRGGDLDDAPAAQPVVVRVGMEAGGQCEGVRHPVEEAGLELGGGGRGRPVHAVDVQGGADDLGEDRGGRVVAGEEGEEVGGLPVDEAGQDQLIEVVEDRVQLGALVGRRVLGRAPGEVREQVARLGGRADRAGRERGEVRRGPGQDAIARGPEFGARVDGRGVGGVVRGGHRQR